jgi:NAD(P)H-dependent FMN reductase
MPGSRRRQPVRFLVFSASLRRDSFNTRLAELAAAAIEAAQAGSRGRWRPFPADHVDQQRRGRRRPVGADRAQYVTLTW